MDGAADRPLVGLFGGFDTGDLGEVALRRVIETELARRRPDIDLIVMAPFGAERPVPGDEGRPARPLPPVSEAAGVGVDALVICGDVLGDDEAWAARYGVASDAISARGVAQLVLGGQRGGSAAAAKVAWFGVGACDGSGADLSGLAGRDVWVRDRATEDRIGGTVAHSGDPLLLGARVFAPETLRRRAGLLRMCGALPAGRFIAIEVTPTAATASGLADALQALLRADPKLSVVVLSLDPTRAPVDSLLRLTGPEAERVHHLPIWAGLDDAAAALSGAAAVVATTPAAAHLAAVLGAPVAAIETGLGDRFLAGIPVFADELTDHIGTLLRDGKAIDTSRAIATLDAAFAELAVRLPRTPGSRELGELRDPVASALAILQQRLVDERTALQAELSRVQAELEHLQGSPEHRLARPIREGYQRWQRRRT